MLHAQWPVAHFGVNVSSATVALGLTLSWFPTSAETKLVSNNRQLCVVILTKIAKFEQYWQRCYQNKAVTFLAAKITSKIAIDMLQGSAVKQNA